MNHFDDFAGLCGLILCFVLAWPLAELFIGCVGGGW